ncbi:2Fe-2S iron-sulfur cluster-binding protein [Streptomyces clavifer]|uniref:2Fe-2S iron-sulfur cluster-binding protein n=1 Tax=Streptomyces clavifer TaxID=68188 RepID=UPI00380DFFBB
MSNEENPEQRHGQPDPYGGWEPTPQGGEYDAEATAFVHLPPEDLANLGNDPLAAPGHGYVPPMILPLTPAAGLDPAATGSWVVQTQSQQERAVQAGEVPSEVHWPDPNHQDPNHQDPYRPEPNHQGSYQQEPYRQEPYGQEYPGAYPSTPQYEQTSSTTAQWNFTESVPAAGPDGPDAASGSASASAEPMGHTGQWTIPVANGDLPEESGEFAASALASPWYADSPPATLPGGASAPWASQEQALPEAPAQEQSPEPQPEPAAESEPELSPEFPAELLPEFPSEPEPVAEAVVEVSEVSEEEASTGTAGPLEPLESLESLDSAPAALDVADALDVPDAPDVSDVSDALGASGEPAEAPELAAVFEAPLDAHGSSTPPGADPAPEGAPDVPSEHPSASYVLHVNGTDRPVSDAWIGESLLYVLRERLGLAGAKDGCSQGECGACNVQVDGRLVASCLVPAATTAGSEVRTVEGLAVDGEPSDVQRALARCGAVQCGFCIPGMAMTVHDLLEGNHAPSELETRQALCGNLCRCSGYRGVLDAVREVVEGREAAEAENEELRIPHQAGPGAGSVQPHAHEGDPR